MNGADKEKLRLALKQYWEIVGSSHPDLKQGTIMFSRDLSQEEYSKLLSKVWSDANELPEYLLVLDGMSDETHNPIPRPPFNAEYLLELFLRKEDRETVIGDLIEGYCHVRRRFDKKRADIWFYKQALGFLLPLLRRAVLKIGALVWLGRMLRRLIL